jgi:hypothetical protein
MDWIFNLILLFVVLTVLERLLSGLSGKAARSDEATESSERAPDRRESGASAELGLDLEGLVGDWITEEAGFDLERRPRVRRPEPERPEPEPTGSEYADLEQPEPGVVSMEEIGMRERGDPVSLERPRRPEDHGRFHDRYGIPEPVADHAEFHERYVGPVAPAARKRRRGGLPELRRLSRAQRAVVWSEIFGPPRGLDL